MVYVLEGVIEGVISIRIVCVTVQLILTYQYSSHLQGRHLYFIHQYFTYDT